MSTRNAGRKKNSFLPLPLASEADARVGSRPLRVCVVSSDIVGPVRNGGVGTAFSALAFALADAGHDVTVLYVGGSWCENGKLEDWVAHYAARKIRLVPLPDPVGPPPRASWPVLKAYATYRWLEAHDEFDVVHTCEWQGHCYYALLARRQGIAFAKTLFCMTTHGPSFWHRENNGDFIDRVDDLELDHIERKSVAWADILLAPSHYLLDWMTERGWTLPARTHVQQYVMPHLARLGSSAPFERSQAVEELVFFGRLEIRKGLVLFCNALDRLVQEPALRAAKVTFLGKVAEISGVPADAYLAQRAERWPWQVALITDQDQAGVMRYLSEPGRLALIPSLADNLPNTVLECLAARIPFLAADAGGIPEMVHPDDTGETCFAPRPDAFAQRLVDALRQGVRPSRFAIDPKANEDQWIRWHAQLAPAAFERTPARPEMLEAPPLVSVCMPHRNRAHYLRDALESLRAQDYPNVEVVVVDDGSDDPAALAYLDELATEFARKDWQIVRQPNQYPGAARNNGVRRARGRWVFFMDDDNYAKPGELSRLVSAAAHSGADILTCFSDVISHRRRPESEAEVDGRWLCLGPAVGVGAFRNAFGDTNSLMRREVFEAVGGFHEKYGVGYEDWELFARACLDGYQMEVVPEALFYYRTSGEGVNTTTPVHANMLQVVGPYIDAAPAEMRELLLFAQGVCLRADRLQAQAATAQPTPLRSLMAAAQTLAENEQGELAWRVYQAALERAREDRDGIATIESLVGIAKVLAGMGKVDVARDALLTALDVSQKINSKDGIKLVSSLLAQLDEQLAALLAARRRSERAASRKGRRAPAQSAGGRP